MVNFTSDPFCINNMSDTILFQPILIFSCLFIAYKQLSTILMLVYSMTAFMLLIYCFFIDDILETKRIQQLLTLFVIIYFLDLLILIILL